MPHQSNFHAFKEENYSYLWIRFRSASFKWNVFWSWDSLQSLHFSAVLCLLSDILKQKPVMFEQICLTEIMTLQFDEIFLFRLSVKRFDC